MAANYSAEQVDCSAPRFRPQNAGTVLDKLATDSQPASILVKVTTGTLQHGLWFARNFTVTNRVPSGFEVSIKYILGKFAKKEGQMAFLFLPAVYHPCDCCALIGSHDWLRFFGGYHCYKVCQASTANEGTTRFAVFSKLSSPKIHAQD